MSVRACLVGVLCVSLIGAASRAAPEEQKEARAILARAIKAVGGEKVLAAEGSLSGKSRGSIYLNGAKTPVGNEWTVQGLDRLKWSSEVTLNERTHSIIVCLD